MMHRIRFSLLLLLFLIIAVALDAQERRIDVVKEEKNMGKRIALVIGNGSYRLGPLKNPGNDASDMAEVLRKCGFEVTLILDAGLKTMEGAVRTLGKKLGKGGVGLFYFSGHGLQVEGKNYLIPVDVTVREEKEIKYKGMSAGFVLEHMDMAGNHMNVLVLDACRDNPFARSFRSTRNGLISMDAPKGTLIAYATGPGKTAADGPGRNGVFTGHLLAAIKESNLEIMRLFRQVRKDVLQATSERQIPWETSSLVGEFYFDFKDSRLDKLKGEVTELETRLKTLRQKIENTENDFERRQALKEAEELKVEIEIQKRRRKRLENNKARKERLERKRKELERSREELRTKRKKELAEAEMRRRKLLEEIAAGKERLKKMKQPIRRLEAEKEVASLEQKIAETKKQINAEETRALQKLNLGYQPLREELNQSFTPKGQFEKTSAYNTRVKNHEEKVASLEKEFKADHAEIEKKYAEEERLRMANDEARVIELKTRKYPVEGLKFKLFNYNADLETFDLKIVHPNGTIQHYFFYIQPEKARQLDERKDLLEVNAYYAAWKNYTSLCRISVVDKVLGEMPVNYRYFSRSEINSMIKTQVFYKKSRGLNLKTNKKISTYKLSLKRNTIIHWTTGLEWGMVSDGSISYKDVKGFVWSQNKIVPSIRADNTWRLPSVEELVSLFVNLDSETMSARQLRNVFWTGDRGVRHRRRLWSVQCRSYLDIDLYADEASLHCLLVRYLNEQDFASQKKTVPNNIKRN